MVLRRQIKEGKSTSRRPGESDRPQGKEDHSPQLYFQSAKYSPFTPNSVDILSRFSTLKVWCMVSSKIVSFGYSHNNAYHLFRSSHKEGSFLA